MRKFLTAIYQVTRVVVIGAIIGCAAGLTIVGAQDLYTAHCGIMSRARSMELRAELLEQEHDRQLIIGEMIQSQFVLEEASLVLSSTVLLQRDEIDELKTSLRRLTNNINGFMQILDKAYPGVREEVLRRMGQGVK